MNVTKLVRKPLVWMAVVPLGLLSVYGFSLYNKKWIRASGPSLQNGILFVSVGVKPDSGTFQPPPQYGTIGVASTSVFRDDAIAYLLIPAGTAIAKGEKHDDTGFKFYVRPSNGKEIRFKGTTYSSERRLVGIQFPITWPESTEFLELIAKDESGSVSTWRIDGFRSGKIGFDTAPAKDMPVDKLGAYQLAAWYNPRSSNDHYPSISLGVRRLKGSANEKYLVSGFDLQIPETGLPYEQKPGDNVLGLNIKNCVTSIGWHPAEQASYVTATYTLQRLVGPDKTTREFKLIGKNTLGDCEYMSELAGNGRIFLTFRNRRNYTSIEYRQELTTIHGQYDVYHLDELRKGSSVTISNFTGDISDQNLGRIEKYPDSFRTSIESYSPQEKTEIRENVLIRKGADSSFSKYFYFNHGAIGTVIGFSGPWPTKN